MADTKLSALAALTGANTATGDLFYIDDVSVTTSKSITRDELRIAMSILTTQGDILYRGAAADARLGTGTNGQVLTAGGAGANPSWTTIATGSASKGLIITAQQYLI